MSQEKAPAFQFYPKDFLTDSHVLAMTLPERGAYITLICVCWLERAVSAEPVTLARLCGVTPAAFNRLWPALEPCFQILDGRLIQPRVERERAKQERYRQLKVEAGKQGGRPKATNNQDGTNVKAEGKQNVSGAEANKSPPSSSSSSSSICNLKNVLASSNG